jgi:non-heme chloroperoxidase
VNDSTTGFATRLSRRDLLIRGASIVVAAGLSNALPAASSEQENVPMSSNPSKGGRIMSTIVTRDGTQIYYNDWVPDNP